MAKTRDKSVADMSHAELLSILQNAKTEIEAKEAEIAEIRATAQAAGKRIQSMLSALGIEFGSGRAARSSSGKPRGGGGSSAYAAAEVDKIASKVFGEVPGSGKGKNAGDIADALSAETGLVAAALKGLAASGKIKRSEEKGARGGRYGDYVKA